MGSNRIPVLLAVAFIVGFVVGYKAKERRILWIKRKRDRLADKLVHAQAQLDMMTKKA